MPLHAHDVPDTVRVIAYIKPQGNALLVLARVPLNALRDVDVPQRAGGYIDFSKVDSALHNAAKLWLADEMVVFANGQRLSEPSIQKARISLSSARTFHQWDTALAYLDAPPLPKETLLYWNQGMLDVLMSYPISDEHAAFSIQPNLERLGGHVAISLRFINARGAERAFELQADPGVVELDPNRWQAVRTFTVLGFAHILDGIDHLLFLLCLVVPFRRFWSLVGIITAFTLAHSITLLIAAVGYAPQALWFAPLVELLIAASILYTAIENVFGTTTRRRWLMALLFGFVHGFGFSFGLQQKMQLAGEHLVSALLAFNLGVEFGQLLVLAFIVPLLNLLMRRTTISRAVTLILSAGVGHIAWHWMVERYDLLAKFPRPTLEASDLALMLRWLIVLIVFSTMVWLVQQWRHARSLRKSASKID